MRRTNNDNNNGNNNNNDLEILAEKPSTLKSFNEPSNQSDFAGFPTMGENNKKSSTFRNDKDSSNLKVYVKGLGGTGNVLFCFVSALGIAHHNNRSAVFSSEMNRLKKIFPKIEINVLKDTPKWKRLGERESNKFDPRFFNMSKKNMKIGKYLQSFKYFKDIFGDIYKKNVSFFDENLLAKSSKFIQKAKHNYRQRNKIKNQETKITSICVHVRRGDFLLQSNIKHGYRVPSSLDIQNAMNYMQTKFKDIVFIVISNDLEWCKENLNRTNVYFSNFTSANEDFVLMCKCDHMIMTVGTFGWWGAWFTSWRGGVAMYYEHQFSANTFMYRSFSRYDWLPPHWLAYTNMTINESKYLGDK